jgi:hypothetical protein
LSLIIELGLGLHVSLLQGLTTSMCIITDFLKFLLLVIFCFCKSRCERGVVAGPSLVQVKSGAVAETIGVVGWCGVGYASGRAAVSVTEKVCLCSIC